MVFRDHSIEAFVLLLLGNGTAMTLLHGLLLFCCVRLRTAVLCSSRRRFAPRGWEQGGRFYREKLKINAWKDRVPQHVGKGGFSKAQLQKTLTPSYLDRFLMETCRGEWYHTACLTGVFFLLFANPPLWGIFFSVLMVLVHGACIAIQRYNRIRLLMLRRKICRSPQRDHGMDFSAEHSESAEL